MNRYSDMRIKGKARAVAGTGYLSASRGKFELPPGEFSGQVPIDKPLTLVGKGKSTWIGSRAAPTVRTTSQGVKLLKANGGEYSRPMAVSIS
jgi:hypothetical protein